jgi:hypothetical protein
MSGKKHAKSSNFIQSRSRERRGEKAGANLTVRYLAAQNPPAGGKKNVLSKIAVDLPSKLNVLAAC